MPDARDTPPSTPSSTGTSPQTSVQTVDPTAELEATEPRRLFGLSLTQILGGALAAVTATVAASFFGVAGTLTGAALGSVVSSIGAAIYSTSLSRAARVSKVLVVRPSGLQASDPAVVPPPVTDDPSVVAVAPAAPSGSPAPVPGSIWAHVRWRPVAVVAGLLFVATMAFVFVTELAIGHPLSDTSGSGTTITDLGGSGGGSTPASSPTPSPSGTSSAEPSTGATPTTSPTPSLDSTAGPSATTPEGSPSVVPSAGGGTTTAPGGGATTTGPAPSGAGAAPTAGG
jgi:hypothetical protein